MSLHIKSLSFSYDKKIIFSDVNLKLDTGKIYYLEGANGEGKTSFLNLIAGLEKPRKGEISFGKVKFVSDSDFVPSNRRKVGYVFQELNLFPHLTNAQNIHFAKPGLPKEEVEELVTELNLKEHLQTYPHLISGGQQQRIAIARSLAAKPQILLMDEPFSNQDKENIDKISKLIVDAALEKNLLVIVASHQQVSFPLEEINMIKIKNKGISLELK